MGEGCTRVTKYFLFVFNLIFFLFGAVIMGFGLWLLLDNQSFLAVLQDSSLALKAASYILIGVGAFSMLMGFVGCLGAIYEIRCLLGLYFACLLLILLAQVAAGALIYFQKDVLNTEMSKIVTKVLDSYGTKNSSTEQAWDYIQRTMDCCGWTGHADWNGNMVIVNSSQLLFPCSCQNISLATGNTSDSGFCEAQTSEWPVYEAKNAQGAMVQPMVHGELMSQTKNVTAQGCSASVEGWLITNVGVVLGICLAVAVIEVLGMILSICLCKNVRTEYYTKVSKY